MVGKLVKRDDAMVLEAEGVEIEPEAIANSQGVCIRARPHRPTPNEKRAAAQTT